MENFNPENLILLSRDLSPRSVDTLDRLQQIGARDATERQDRKLRRLYGKVVLGLLVAQVAFVVTVVFLLGFGVITLDRWVATTALGGTSGVSGMVYLTLRYLFPPPFRTA